MLDALGQKGSLKTKSEVAELVKSDTKPQSHIHACGKRKILSFLLHLQERLGLRMGFAVFRRAPEPSLSSHSGMYWDKMLTLCPVCRQKDGGMGLSLLLWGADLGAGGPAELRGL